MSLSNLALSVGQSGPQVYDPSSVANIIEFAEASWGLGATLFPVQRVVLKAHYGLALDDNPHGFDLTSPVPLDHPAYDPSLVDDEGNYKYRVEISLDFRRKQVRVFTEAGYLRYLYDEGRSNIREVIPGVERREMVLSIGRRSGKTLVSAIISSYETYKLIKKVNPHAYYRISPSNPIQIISVATDKDQAALLYNDVSGFFRKCQFFNPYTANNTQTYARFQTPADIQASCRYADDVRQAKVSLKVTFRSCVAKGIRGAGNIVIILDELAHFTDNKSQSSAGAVYKAASPSRGAFAPKDKYNRPIGDVEGRIISISSPMGREGFFYDLYQAGFTGDESAQGMLCIQAPTWEVNPSIPASYFIGEYAKDASGFFTEFGAEFTDRTRGWIEREEDLLNCVDPTRRPIAQAPARRPHFMGIDFALANDATAVAIGHLEELPSGKKVVVVDLVDQIKAGEGDYAALERLDFDEVADWILDLSRRFYIVEGMFDQWSGIIFEQALTKRGLGQIKSHKLLKAQSSAIYKNFKDLLFEQSVVLYDWPIYPGEHHCPYIAEILTLQAERTSKNIVVVEAPQTVGFHDDMSDALVRMCFTATQNISTQGYISRPGNRGQEQQHNATRAGRLAHLKSLQTGTAPDRQDPRKNKNRRGTGGSRRGVRAGNDSVIRGLNRRR